MPFCSNCGYKLSEEANFCPQCGNSVKQKTAPEIPSPPEESIPPIKRSFVPHKADMTFTLLDQGDIFNENFRIEKVLGRDNDGITYLAVDERCGALRSLKLLYQSYFDNVEKLLGSLVRMSKIKDISHPNVAKVHEVNQSHKPAYLVAEYIDGQSLAVIKEQNPDYLDEQKCREIALQLVEAAIAIRSAGLAIRNLNLNNIVLSKDNRAVILSAGINYDVSDEREDIFNMGIILAKLFSNSAFYETLYTSARLLDKRFDYISGITESTNEVIAICLQKNLMLRYRDFAELAKALTKLKPIKPEDIYYTSDNNVQRFKGGNDLGLPDRRLDIYFWAMIIFIVIFVFVLLTTNLLDTIFGQKKTTFKFTGFITEVTDSVEIVQSVADDSYRRIKSTPNTLRGKSSQQDNDQSTTDKDVSPAVTIPPAPSALKPTSEKPDLAVTPNQNKPVINPTSPADFVYISSGTFALGNLDKNAKDNVSLSSYYISKTEVTQAQWNSYMKPANFSTVGNNLPADNISWLNAVQYCNLRSEAEGLTSCYKIITTSTSKSVSCDFRANGYRLPTEAEWEYAARAKKLTAYSGSDRPEQVAWFRVNSSQKIHPVKSKTHNAFYLYDMTGNVSEWCWDWHSDNYAKDMPFVNPRGPSSGINKVIRGGNIDSNAGKTLEVIYRYKGLPSKAYPHVGFRVVRAR